MFNTIKKYWDIIGGVIAGLGIALAVGFKLEMVQLCYSVLILVLVCIGVLRFIKQATEKDEDKREHSIIDDVVDGQTSNKALRLAQSPTKEGEQIGKKILLVLGGTKQMREKVKTFFSKFKGYMLTAALGILTVVEMTGGYINAAFGGMLVIDGVAVVPCVTLLCSVVVGSVSNGYTTEQREKIKALFSKSNTNELVLAEIKKTIKEKTTQLAQFNKVLTTQEHEVGNYQSELETLNNALQAKREMFNMVPQLATNEDVQLAKNAVAECQNKIANKKAEIEKTKETIDNLTTTINALKNQL